MWEDLVVLPQIFTVPECQKVSGYWVYFLMNCNLPLEIDLSVQQTAGHYKLVNL